MLNPQGSFSSDDDNEHKEIQQAARTAIALLHEAKAAMSRQPVSAGMMVNDAIKHLEHIQRLAGAPEPPRRRPWERGNGKS